MRKKLLLTVLPTANLREEISQGGGDDSAAAYVLVCLKFFLQILLNSLEYLANVGPDTKNHTHKMKNKTITAF